MRGEPTKLLSKNQKKNKVAWNCLIRREIWSKMFFDNFWQFFFVDKYGRVAAAHYGEARAHARPARRGARSTPRGYAPLESSGNGCLRQPMQTFFYCDSHKSQQRGKTPRVNFSLFDNRKWSHSNCAILIVHSKHYQQLPHTCQVSKSFTVGTYIH